MDLVVADLGDGIVARSLEDGLSYSQQKWSVMLAIEHQLEAG